MPRDRDLVVGIANRLYAVERPWGRLPSEYSFEFISQLAVDRLGFVYVFQRGDPPVVVFDPTGEFVRAWGEGVFADAHGIFITPDDRVFLVDRDAHQVQIFNTDGDFLGALGERHVPHFQAPFNHPTDAAVASDGDVYVSDGYGNSVVHRFSGSGELIQTWGRPGRGAGEFSTPHAVWVDRSDRVLVVDRENHRVQIFDRCGRFLDQWGDLYLPMDIYVDHENYVYVTDQIPRLSMFKPDGTLAGRCRPVLNLAHGIWGSPSGDIFLAEINPTRITKLSRIE